MEHIDQNKHLAVKENRIGWKRYDSKILLRVLLFAFLEHGYVSTREIEKLCNYKLQYKMSVKLSDNYMFK